MNDLTSEVTLLTEASADTSGVGGDQAEPQGPLDEFKMREVQVREREREGEGAVKVDSL